MPLSVHRRSLRMAVTATVILLLIVFGNAIAQTRTSEANDSASPGTGTPTAGDNRNGQYCAVIGEDVPGPHAPELTAAIERQEALTGKPANVLTAGETHCFGTEEEFESFKKGRNLIDDATTSEATEAESARAVQASYLLTGWYFGAGYATEGGPIIAFYANTPCTVQSHVWISVGEIIDDEMSSYRVYNGCDTVRMFRNTSLVDGPYICAWFESGNWPQCWYIGDGINDQISSFTIA